MVVILLTYYAADRFEGVMMSTERTPWRWRLDVPKHVADLPKSDEHI